MPHVDIHIRPYRPADRSAVRRVAWETSDKGQPGDRLFPDRSFLEDIVTRYYTDFEPESSFIAEQNDQISGYITGCMNTQRFQRFTTWRILPAALCGAIRRGALSNPLARRLARINLCPAHLPLASRHVIHEDYPAHLHINLAADFRGHGIGGQLMDHFLDKLRAARIAGVHVRVREDNTASRRFFERQGFTLITRRIFMRLDETPDGVLYSTIYGLKL